MIARFLADVRHGARVFLRQPLRAAIAVVTLSLAVGANTAIFSVLHAVMFRPFSFPSADRAVIVVERRAQLSWVSGMSNACIIG